MSFDRVQFRQPTSGETPEASTLEVSQTPTAPVNTKMPTQKGKDMTISRGMTIGVIVFVLLAGVASGFAVNSFSGGMGGSPIPVEQNKTAAEVESAVKVGAVFGVPDEKTFRDEVDGVLIKGGISGEGSHTLLREGGVSQNVYLTSSVVDLDQFENMKVKVWGETFKGQKAGWLMDVGRLEVSQLDATKPSWYKEDDGE